MFQVFSYLFLSTWIKTNIFFDYLNLLEKFLCILGLLSLVSDLFVKNKFQFQFLEKWKIFGITVRCGRMGFRRGGRPGAGFGWLVRHETTRQTRARLVVHTTPTERRFGRRRRWSFDAKRCDVHLPERASFYGNHASASAVLQLNV